MIILIACLAFLLVFGGNVSADTLVVYERSSPCTSGASYRSIQEAVDASVTGDIIVVCEGTYEENVKVSKGVSIQSYSGASVTRVIGYNGYEHIFYVNASNVNITGLNVSSFYGPAKDVAGIILTGGDNCNISNNYISSNYFGILLNYSSTNKIMDNLVLSNRNGIRLFNSSNSIVGNNTVLGNYYGISLASSSNNTVVKNTASSNSYHGISLYSSSDNTVINNIANSNIYDGIRLYSSSDNNTVTNNSASASNFGFYLYNSFRNTLKNKASFNYYGLAFYSMSDNYLTESTVDSNNFYGLYFESSSNNSIYNNFFNNSNNTYFDGANFSNDWNTTKQAGGNVIGGPYLGGNFWAYPNGTGFSESCTDGDLDGICDSNHALAFGNVDYLPLTFAGNIETYSIPFLLDWNLISLPLVQENTSLGGVLASIEGNYTVVYAWIDGGWKKSTAIYNPLTEMNRYYGYWINMSAPDTLEVSGTTPTSTTINVSPGWNLVGYPSFTARNITDVLSTVNYTVVYAWINGGWKKSTAVYDPLTLMEPGYGYWINVTDSGSYDVSN